MQADAKSLIAYSSVRHMGTMLVGVFCFNELSLWGVWLVVVSHAFVSRLLFFLTGLNYQSYFTRQIVVLRGQANCKRVLSLIWVFALVANFSVPPFLGLLGELSFIWILFSLDFFYMFILGVVLYLVSYCCVYMLRVVVHGQNWGGMSTVLESEASYIVCVIHLLPVLLLTAKAGWFFCYFNSLILK